MSAEPRRYRTWWPPYPLSPDLVAEACATACDPDAPLSVLLRLPGHWDVLERLVRVDPFPTPLRSPVWAELAKGPRPWAWLDCDQVPRRWAELVVACGWLTPTRFARALLVATWFPESVAVTLPVLAGHRKFTAGSLGMLLDHTRAADRDALLEMVAGWGEPWEILALAYAAATRHSDYAAGFGGRRLEYLGPHLAACPPAALEALPHVAAVLAPGQRFVAAVALARAATATGKRERRIRLSPPQPVGLTAS